MDTRSIEHSRQTVRNLLNPRNYDFERFRCERRTMSRLIFLVIPRYFTSLNSKFIFIVVKKCLDAFKKLWGGDWRQRGEICVEKIQNNFQPPSVTYSHDKTRIVEAYVIMPRWLRSITRGNHGNDVIYPVFGEGGIAFRLLLLSSLRASLLPQMLEFPSTTSSLNKPCFRNEYTRLVTGDKKQYRNWSISLRINYIKEITISPNVQHLVISWNLNEKINKYRIYVILYSLYIIFFRSSTYLMVLPTSYHPRVYSSNINISRYSVFLLLRFGLRSKESTNFEGYFLLSGSQLIESTGGILAG